MREHQAALPHLASRVIGVPLAVTERKLHVLLHVLGPRIGLGLVAMPDGLGASAEARAELAGRREGGVAGVHRIGGVAVIPIMGTIVQRASGIFADSGLVSVEAIRKSFRSALADPDITAILFHVDSFGGEVAGIADLADEIRAARGKKPMKAFADEAMYSAAYFLGSQADRVTLARSAGLGSIGTIAVHTDLSKADEMAGVKFTIVKAGKHKAELNDMEPLSPEAHQRLQEEVDFHNGLFVSAVARARALPVATVRGFEALTFNGAKAVEVGLADAVETFDEAVASLQKAARGPRAAATSGGGARAMSDVDRTDDEQQGKVVPHEEFERRQREARDEGARLARETERARAQAIKDLCIINDTPELAMELITGDLSVDEVRAELVNRKARAQQAQGQVSSHHLGFVAGAEHPLITQCKRIREDILARQRRA